MVYLGLPINSMVIFHGELLNNQRVYDEIDDIEVDQDKPTWLLKTTMLDRQVTWQYGNLSEIALLTEASRPPVSDINGYQYHINFTQNVGWSAQCKKTSNTRSCG